MITNQAPIPAVEPLRPSVERRAGSSRRLHECCWEIAPTVFRITLLPARWFASTACTAGSRSPPVIRYGARPRASRPGAGAAATSLAHGRVDGTSCSPSARSGRIGVTGLRPSGLHAPAVRVAPDRVGGHAVGGAGGDRGGHHHRHTPQPAVSGRERQARCSTAVTVDSASSMLSKSVGFTRIEAGVYPVVSSLVSDLRIVCSTDAE